MANADHEGILRQGVQAWNAWRYGILDATPRLSGADVSRAELSCANLSYADLCRTRLFHADLSDANLTHADLACANVPDADLRRAKFVHANLCGADFRSTNLSEADLSEADLTNADLFSVQMSSANLLGAYLFGTNLSGAHLWKTNFSKSRLYRTVLGDVDLSSALGLETADHHGPSIIGIDALAKSRGQISESFLRGCGLQDWTIECAKLFHPNLTSSEVTEILYSVFPLRSDQALQFYSCFISYGHADKPFARQLHDTLQNQGIRCWLDEKQLLPGDPLYEHIDEESGFGTNSSYAALSIL